MKIEEYIILKRELEENIGKEKIKNITDEITQIVTKNNLDVTPNVIKDLFKYIRLNIFISKI